MAHINLTAGPAIDLKAAELEAKLDRVLTAIRNEALRAMKKHGPMNSSHEAFGVIYEEFNVEFANAMVANDAKQQCLEMVQVGAMAARALVDVYSKDDTDGGK